MDLIPTISMRAIARVLTFGASKYGRNNWRKGLAWSRCYAAAQRHLTAWWDGEDKDPETGFSHLDHALAEIAFLREFEDTHRELDDRFKPTGPSTTGLPVSGGLSATLDGQTQLPFGAGATPSL